MANTEAPLSDARPILSFAPPDVSAIPKVEKHSVPPFVRRPSSGRQGERLAPQFAALRAAFEGRRLELSDTTPEDDPELVAVFDLAGAADDFYKAASKVPGLEFLFDVEGDDVDPDDDFYFADNQGDAADKSVPQHLYMVMSNANALGELIRLFELWQADRAIKLSTGLNPLKGSSPLFVKSGGGRLTTASGRRAFWSNGMRMPVMLVPRTCGAKLNCGTAPTQIGKTLLA